MLSYFPALQVFIIQLITLLYLPVCLCHLVSVPASGSRVSVQLQLKYRRRDGRRMLRVLTAEREVSDVR